MLGDWGVVVVLLDGSVLAKSDCLTQHVFEEGGRMYFLGRIETFFSKTYNWLYRSKTSFSQSWDTSYSISN